MEKKSEEILAELYRNGVLAMQSIEDILPAADEAAKEELEREYGEYEKLVSRAAALAREKGIVLKEPGPFKKAMMWSGIKMNTVVDKSSQHIAQLMVRGTAMGVTSLRTTQTDSEGYADGEIKKLLDELIAREEEFEENLKKFL